jgi:hypothetical protein
MEDLAPEEAMGQPDRPELEAERGECLPVLPHEDLGAPTSDEPLLEDGHRLQHTEMDEPRLLDAADDVHVDARLAPGSIDEQLCVLGLAHRARGDGVDLGVADLGDLPEALERLDAAVDRHGVERATTR